MKKRTLITFAVLSVALFATLMLSGVRADWVGYPGPDTLSDCDHTGTYGGTDDTFTAVGVAGYYGWEPPAYVHGLWYFMRGYGGDYPALGSMTCYWTYTPYYGVHYDPADFSWEYRNHAWAYYHDWDRQDYDLPRSATISGYTGSYFYDPDNPNDWWYVSSYVGMTAGYP
jgi:hypothetical protein